MGKILREWGVRGQVKCESFNPRSPILSNKKHFYRESAGHFLKLTKNEAKAHGRFWLLKFSGYENPESARALRGDLLYLPRESLPKLPAGEIYLSDLEGWKVLGPDGKPLGLIQHFERVGGSEVMMIGPNAKETVGIPYESDFVQSTSRERQLVVLKDLALDLFEINAHD